MEGYRKIDPEMAIEVTEFAEILYNFKGAMTLENIKANLVSFLLANHYRRIDLEKLTVLTKEQRDAVYDTLPPEATCGDERLAFCEAQLDHNRKTIEEGKV